MDIGTRLRRARTEAGLTQAELADRAGTSQPTVSAYEQGMKDPRLLTLDRLLAATGARIEILGSAAGSRATHERGRRLAEVLALAEALPARPRRTLDYPRLVPLSGETRRSRR